MDKIKHRRRIIRIIQLLLTVLAVSLVAYVVDWGQFIDAIYNAQLGFLAIAYVLFVADRLLMSYKWDLLLAVQDIRVPLWENWSVYSLASLSSVVLPATVGADALRIAWLWRRGAQIGKATASVVLERIIGFAVGLSVAAISLTYLVSGIGEPSKFQALLLLVLGTLLIVVVGLVLSFHIKFELFLQRYMHSSLVHKWVGWFGRFHCAYVSYRSERRTIAVFTFLTLGEQLLMLFTNYLIVVALNIEISALQFCAALSVAMVIARLPVTIDGIGIFEGILMLLLIFGGVDPADTIAFALVGRFINVTAFIPGAIVSLALIDLRLQNLLREKQEEVS